MDSRSVVIVDIDKVDTEDEVGYLLKLKTKSGEIILKQIFICKYELGFNESHHVHLNLLGRSNFMGITNKGYDKIITEFYLGNDDDYKEVYDDNLFQIIKMLYKGRMRL